MLCDHAAIRLLAYGLIPALYVAGENMAAERWNQAFWILRSVGRMAFPIYVFLLTEGFCHTRNRRRYALRLGVFALISEIPFDLLVYGKIWDTHSQNVFFTLFLGVLMLTAVDWIGRNTDAALAQYRQMAVVVGAALLAWFLRTDYDAAGIMLIAVLFWFRLTPDTACLAGFVLMAAAEFRPVYIPGLAVSFFLIRCYNGTRGSWKWQMVFLSGVSGASACPVMGFQDWCSGNPDF